LAEHRKTLIRDRSVAATRHHVQGLEIRPCRRGDAKEVLNVILECMYAGCETRGVLTDELVDHCVDFGVVVGIHYHGVSDREGRQERHVSVNGELAKGVDNMNVAILKVGPLVLEEPIEQGFVCLALTNDDVPSEEHGCPVWVEYKEVPHGFFLGRGASMRVGCAKAALPDLGFQGLGNILRLKKATELPEKARV